MKNIFKEKNVLRAAALVVMVLVVFLLSLRLAESELVQNVVSQFGYLGVFVIAILSGFNLVIPIPAITFMSLFTASGLMFWPLVLVITIGMTIGDTVGFLIGDAGRKLTVSHAEEIRNGKIYKYIEGFRQKNRTWPYIFLAFYAAFAPAPNEVVVIPMAFAGYPLRYMFPVVLIGNFLFNILIAFGLLGIAGLL